VMLAPPLPKLKSLRWLLTTGTIPKGCRSETDAPRALLAKAERGNLIYAGAAFIGLRAEEREELQSKLSSLAVEHPSISWLRNREAQWVKPKLSLKVRHLAFGSGLLRHATVRGLS